MSRRDWLSIGEQAMADGTEHELPDADGEWHVVHRPISRDQVDAAIRELEWFDPTGRRLPMSPALAIEETVRQLQLPKVSRIALWGGVFNDGGYAFYGIEANYRDGRARVYVLDRGHDIVPLCVDFTPVEVEAAAG